MELANWKMIKARKLFLVPSLSILFLSWIPIIGVPVVIIICLYWYINNQSDIHLYFRGIEYRENETSKEELESLR